MANKDLLLEIGCEELPATSLKRLSDALANGLTNAFKEVGLTHQQLKTFATPRRLAVLVEGLSSNQPAQKIERFGPAEKDAFDKQGAPTLACLGFAKSCGVTVDKLQVKKTPKGNRIFVSTEKPGNETVQILPELINKVVKQLPIRKPMRWGNHDTRFARPVHWVVLMFGREVIPADILGQRTGKQTRGHRFMHPSNMPITEPKDYNMLLYSSGYVIANFAQRQQEIEKQIRKISTDTLIDPSLLKEVVGLVEWPVALKGQFNPDFLALPKEVLITSMKTHQKTFPIADDDNGLKPAFVLISNIDSKDPSAVIHGNERVINARLSDAQFFYDNDVKHGLSSHQKGLANVVFQKQLGTLADKSKRISKLAQAIAKKINADVATTKQAAALCKCDLLSEMVGEFPSLQGTMGYYYALKDGETDACANAIKEHYYPRFSGDELPNSLPGAALALADRLDTLVGTFGINQIPSGDKDPFALRRAALGIIRILIEKNLALDVVNLLKQAQKGYHVELPNKNVVEQAFDFIMSRLRAWYLEQNMAPEVFEAVLACKPTAPLDFDHRIKAVLQFQKLPEATALAAANKRVGNILKKQAEKIKIPAQPNAKLFEKEEEKTLATQLDKQSKAFDSLYQKSNYTEALSELSVLKEPVDQFFDQVMIMVDDEKMRNNRLALLASLRHLFTQVADISLLPQ